VLGEATVVASWYGPGFWDNRTACGQVLTPELLGVAHLTLPCGTLVTLRYRGVTVTMPVVDHGPHVAGREFDLTYRARVALGCPDLCWVGWQR
jgi:rare lipoprotein A (peptidoglycan hydrolase)